jgi:HEAT repeat protein
MRSDQEKRIKEEIAGLQQLAEEERHRLDEETQRRVQAELRLQQERERFKAEAAARLKADAEYERLKQQSQPPDKAQAGSATEADVEMRASAPRVVENFIVASTSPEAIRSDLLSDDPMKRAAALAGLVHIEGKDAFGKIVSAFDDESPAVRNAAALALLKIDEERPVEWFTTAFEEASEERRRNIGLAIAGSGLAAEAVNSLSGGTREDTYNALCVLFLMAKTGEVEPLVKAIENHKDLEVRRAAIRLLTLSGQSEIADAAVKRRLNGYPSPTVS